MSENIYKKMLDITSELTVVAKNLNVGVGKSAYKGTGEADVLSAVRPLEEKHRVYSYPYSRKVIEAVSSEVESTDYKGNPRKTNRVFMRIETVYRFVDIDNPESFIDITSYGDGIDSQDKAPGKAMTYSDKYALLKAYKIITGEDPDQFNSDQEPFGRRNDHQYQQPMGEPAPQHVQYQQPIQYEQPPMQHQQNVIPMKQDPQTIIPTRIQLDSLYELARQKGFIQTQVWKAAKVQNESQMTMGHYMAVFERLQKLPDVKQGNLNL